MEDLKKEVRFTKKQRIAVVSLLLLLFVSYGYNFFLKPALQKTQPSFTLEEVLIENKLETPLSELKEDINKITKQKKKKGKVFYNPPPKYRPFNPNATDSIIWIEMGLKPWTVSNILKYQRKGGQFYDCNDLARIYSLDTSTYNKILPYCRVEKSNKTANKWKSNKKKIDRTVWDKKGSRYEKQQVFKSNEHKPWTRDTVKKTINFNLADSTELQKLYGIGPVLSSRIVKYRNRLGGFHNEKQLLEVYGIKEEVLSDNKDRIKISGPVSKLDINATKDSLARHPYISWTEAKIISRYTERHGPIEKLSVLQKIHGLSDGLIERLLPYLDME